MTTVERTFEVAASAGTVLDYLADFGNTEQWDPATQRSVRLDTGSVTRGATWRNTTKFFGRTTEITYTLHEREDDTLVFLGENNTMTTTDTITVRPSGDGAVVTYHVDLDMHGIAVLATPAMKIGFEKLATETERRMIEVLNHL